MGLYRCAAKLAVMRRMSTKCEGRINRTAELVHAPFEMVESIENTLKLNKWLSTSHHFQFSGCEKAKLHVMVQAET